MTLTLIWAALRSGFGAIFTFCSKPPGSWIALAAAVVIAIWWYGQHEFNKGVESVKAAQAKHAVIITERRNKITLDVDMNFKTATLENANATQRRLNEVETHVTPKTDSDFPVPCGFVRVFNDATHGPLPDPAVCPDGAASDIAFSAVGKTETINDGQYDNISTQLKALQDWIRQQQSVHQ